MCDHRPAPHGAPTLAVAVPDRRTSAPPAPGRPVPCPPGFDRATHGSRRRRLWELDSAAHCPVIGVCLPMDALRKLVRQVGGTAAPDGNYPLHAHAVQQAREHGALAEAMQKLLDRRATLALQRAARLKTTEALEAWWAASIDGPDLPGTLWAVLTHPRCAAPLADRVLADVHMLQHQLGSARRVDLARHEALVAEHAVLARQLAEAQRRCQGLLDAQRQRLEAAQAALVRARAELIGRDTALAQARDALDALHRSAPDLPSRHALDRRVQEQAERILELQRELMRSREEALHEARRADAAAAHARRLAEAAGTPAEAPADDHAAPPDAAGLRDCSVLCVGGRPAAVPIYRQLVERTGGRFMHHDGGDEDHASRLDATLAAADLVICQTGCISHDAYWRVKEHCKRTGKRCVFVDTPSRAALQRALAEVGAEPARA